MKYLKRIKGSKYAVHLWKDPDDTYCKLWSTGGITKKERYELVNEIDGSKVCVMCSNNQSKVPNQPNDNHKKPMQRTVEGYKRLAESDLELIMSQREKINKLRCKVNQLEQELGRGSANIN